MSTFTGGGAILGERGAELTMEGCDLSANAVKDGNGAGGAILLRNKASLVATNTTMEHNYAGVGGAVALDHFSSMKLTKGTVSNNQLHSETSDESDSASSVVGQGGGIYAGGYSQVELSDGMQVYNNIAVIRGGGLFLDNHASLTSTGGMDFRNNKAGEAGGAVYLTHVECEVVEDEIGNSTLMSWSPPCIEGGAGCYSTTTAVLDRRLCVNMQDLTFRDNEASLGGAVFWKYVFNGTTFPIFECPNCDNGEGTTSGRNDIATDAIGIALGYFPNGEVFESGARMEDRSGVDPMRVGHSYVRLKFEKLKFKYCGSSVIIVL